MISVQIPLLFINSFPFSYKDVKTNYADDIAVLVLTESLVFNERVNKIVISFDNKYWSDRNGQALTGQVVGWGKGKNGHLQERLRFVNIDVISCNSPTRGKFCGIGNNNQSLCAGDGGSGFVVMEGAVPILIGVTSTLVQNRTSTPLPSCDGTPTSFTNLVSHKILFDDASKFLNSTII